MGPACKLLMNHMKTTVTQNPFKGILLFGLLLLIMSSCKRDDYYLDGGKANPVFQGNIMQYLESDPKLDTIAQIVKLSGMEEVFANENITFFCPTDEVIRRTIGQVNTGGLNTLLFDVGKDTIKTLSDIQPEIWQKYLSRYIFKGSFLLKDYPQIDFDLKPIYPGAFYYSYNKDLANIGVVYNSANGVQYVGYRQLSFSYLPDPSDPENFISAAVATSDVQPSNGVVHVLALTLFDRIGDLPTNPGANQFGFTVEFYNDVSLTR